MIRLYFSEGTCSLSDREGERGGLEANFLVWWTWKGGLVCFSTEGSGDWELVCLAHGDDEIWENMGDDW